MRYKVELHPDVVWALRHRMTDAEVDAFYSQLEKARTAPLAGSEFISDPELSPYGLRFFRFGRMIAVFQLDQARQRMRVYQCRPSKPNPRRRRNDASRDEP